MTVLVVGVAGVVCPALVHSACFRPAPPLPRPEAGSPLARYCRALEPWKPWLSFTLVPTAAMAAVGWPIRRRAWLVILLAGLIVAALAFAVGHAASLPEIRSSPLT